MLRKLAIAITLAAALSGCAVLQKLEQTYTFVKTATVPAQYIAIAASTFDGIEGTATQYLTYCVPFVDPKTHLALTGAPTICSDNNRRIVIRTMRSGRAARNQAETYIQQSIPAPGALYNSLVAAITTLQNSAATAARSQ